MNIYSYAFIILIGYLLIPFSLVAAGICLLLGNRNAEINFLIGSIIFGLVMLVADHFIVIEAAKELKKEKKK